MISAAVEIRPARVLLVDDQTLFRAGLARLLEADPRLAVVGQAADGPEAIKLAHALQPDVVLMDMRMPGMDGVEATRQMVAENPDIKILILSTFEADKEVLHALRAGARGYVLKDCQADAIASSVMAVLAGDRVMASAVANRVLDMLDGTTPKKEFHDGLTDREVEILKLIAAGLANKQVAYRLHISDKTVRNHVSNIYEKLKISDRSQAILYAIRKGLIEV